MYYLFIIKEKFFNINDNYLYDILYKLKNLKKENYNYGISLFYNVCNLFDVKSLNNYINLKYKIKRKNNRYYLDKDNYFEIRKSSCIINNYKYLKEILCIFYIYKKNIFVCNFNTHESFWIKEKFYLKKKV